MSRKSILVFSAIALAAASALAAYTLKKSKKTQENEDDDEIHFIKIEDGDVDEKKVDPSFEEKLLLCIHISIWILLRRF